MKKYFLLKFINFWPPFIGAGIRVRKIARDFRSIDVQMKLRFWNQNYVGVHFGGSLYAMMDPFLMLMLLENLGPAYIVWDKAAAIRFLKPGKGRVHAHFTLSQEQIDSIRSQADQNPKTEPVFELQIRDDSETVIAVVEKTLYVRRKDKRRQAVDSTDNQG